MLPGDWWTSGTDAHTGTKELSLAEENTCALGDSGQPQRNWYRSLMVTSLLLIFTSRFSSKCFLLRFANTSASFGIPHLTEIILPSLNSGPYRLLTELSSAVSVIQHHVALFLGQCKRRPDSLSQPLLQWVQTEICFTSHWVWWWKWQPGNQESGSCCLT